MKQNDKSLLEFRNDLGHVAEAENIILDGLLGDIKALKEELEVIHETAKAGRLCQHGANIPSFCAAVVHCFDFAWW